MNYQIELFHSLLNDFLQGESALLTLDGTVLGVRGKQPITYGTLATAGKIACQYLQLKEGDIALLNDPYSGGGLLSDLTFIMAISEDLLWVTRRSLERSLRIAKTVEDEGLRIPPTPLRQKNKLNEVILSAMQAHPACPPHFVEWLKEQCRDLTVQAKKLLDALEYTGFTITADLIKEYLELSKNSATQKINERASGEARVDVVLDSGELLRLNLEIKEGRISLDFGGTSAAKTVSLTESAAFGACFSAISQFYGFDQVANSGSFSVLQITKPTGCWLVAKYPAATYKGMTCGVAALETAIDLTLSQIHQNRQKAFSSYCPLNFDLQYNNKHALLTLPGGQGASAASAGSCAHMNSLSIETLEREFPVKVLRVDLRQSPEGKGKFRGGSGLLMKLEARGEIQATWMTDLTLHRPRLPKNCNHGDACEVSVEQGGAQKALPVLGQQIFSIGDVITLISGSGGGYGKD